jgi:hypothetical protein
MVFRESDDPRAAAERVEQEVQRLGGLELPG